MEYEPVVAPKFKLRSRGLPWVVLGLLTPLLLLLPITHDAIWQMWIGRQMLHGARLYTDIIEVNPPLWFWMAVPLAAVGEGLGIEPRVVVIGFFLGAIALSMLLSPARYRLALLIALAILPLRDFGQREHFALIAMAPYVFLIAKRMEGSEARLAAVIGIFAAVGLALKPHFVIVPITLELLVWRKSRVRPETVALAFCALAYAIAVPVFAAAYLTNIVPIVWQAYGAFRGQTSNALCFLAFAIAGVGALGRRGSPVTRSLALAALAFLPAVIIQGKGWSYHAIPARGFLFLAVVIELLRERREPMKDGLLFTAALLCLYPLGVYRNAARPQMEQHLQGVPRGASIAVLASNPSLMWPMVDEHGLKWTLRDTALWRLAASIENPALTPELKRIMAEDLRAKPDIVIIDRRPILGPAAEALLPENYLAQYKPKLQTRTFKSYVRIGGRADRPLSPSESGPLRDRRLRDQLL